MTMKAEVKGMKAVDPRSTLVLYDLYMTSSCFSHRVYDEMGVWCCRKNRLGNIFAFKIRVHASAT
jgi:hypothetical protein